MIHNAYECAMKLCINCLYSWCMQWIYGRNSISFVIYYFIRSAYICRWFHTICLCLLSFGCLSLGSYGFLFAGMFGTIDRALFSILLIEPECQYKLYLFYYYTFIEIYSCVNMRSVWLKWICHIFDENSLGCHQSW